MLLILASFGRGDARGSGRCQIFEIHMAACFPSAFHLVARLCEVHAAHGTGIDVPGVQFASFENTRAARGSEQVDIAMNVFCSAAVERAHNALVIGKDGHPTAAASPGRLVPGGPFGGECFAVVIRFSDPNLAASLTLRGARSLPMPGYVDVSG